MKRRTGTAALTGGMAALIAVTGVIGVPLWVTIVLVVLALPVVVLTALTWSKGARRG